jgi:hypothetical protein
MDRIIAMIGSVFDALYVPQRPHTPTAVNGDAGGRTHHRCPTATDVRPMSVIPHTFGPVRLPSRAYPAPANAVREEARRGS